MSKIFKVFLCVLLCLVLIHFAARFIITRERVLLKSNIEDNNLELRITCKKHHLIIDGVSVFAEVRLKNGLLLEKYLVGTEDLVDDTKRKYKVVRWDSSENLVVVELSSGEKVKIKMLNSGRIHKK